MINILLVKIQPMDRDPNLHIFNDEKENKFQISVLNGDPLQFTASKKDYEGTIDAKSDEISKSLNVKDKGYVVAIDRYPSSQFNNGVYKPGSSCSKFPRYEIECLPKNFCYDTIILLAHSFEPIVLSTLKFACHEIRGFHCDFIAIEKDAVLSVKSPFGEFIGIPLEHCNEGALKPDHPKLFYTMRFEKVSLPAVILQKFLETKLQKVSEQQEEIEE